MKPKAKLNIIDGYIRSVSFGKITFELELENADEINRFFEEKRRPITCLEIKSMVDDRMKKERLENDKIVDEILEVIGRHNRFPSVMA